MKRLVPIAAWALLALAGCATAGKESPPSSSVPAAAARSWISIDSTVPVENSDVFFAALDAAEVQVYFDRVQGWPHAMDVEAGVNAHCSG